MIKGSIFFVIMNLFFVTSINAGALKCSRNKTEFIFVNGMNNDETEAGRTTQRLKDVIKFIQMDLDSEGKIGVSNVTNLSFGTHYDTVEYVADVARHYGIKDAWRFFNQLSPFQTYVNRKKFLPSGLFSASNVEKFFIKAIANEFSTKIPQLQASNTGIHAELKKSVVEKLADNRKVILIAHSQGNAIIGAASKELPQVINGENMVEKYMGSLHVASPVNFRAASKSRLIKLKSDLIVGNLLGISEAPNYEYPLLSGEGMTVSDRILEDILNYALMENSTERDWLGHNMVSVYLDNTRLARKIGSDDMPQSMQNIFKNNLIEIAQELEDNCEKLSEVIPMSPFQTFFEKINTSTDYWIAAPAISLQPYRDSSIFRLQDGDLITMEVLGDYGRVPGENTAKDTVAIFSDGEKYIAPGIESTGITFSTGVGGNFYRPVNGFKLSINPNAPSIVQVPAGAKYLYFSADSGVFYDNSDYDNNYKVRLLLTVKPPPPVVQQ